MKKFLTALILLCLSSACMAACPEQIKEFYTAYLSNILRNDSGNAALCKTFFTEELIDKVDRVGNATGADPVIRAQDANEDTIETLSVRDLGDDWYMVSYLWKKGDKGTLTEIPLKAQMIDGNCKITYITPVWNGNRYGDELLTCRDTAKVSIDQTSGLSFLKSFYAAYTAEYCAMPKDLNGKLDSLRVNHLSKDVLEQFKNAEAENSEDGLPGYDLLIDNFDFDCLWCESLTVTHLKDDSYQIVYNASDKVHKMIVTVKRKDNNWRIDRLYAVN